MRIIQASGTTHPGDRDFNEDAVLVAEDVPVFAVSDGMGGPGAGDIAASIAVEAVKLAAPDLQRHLKKVAAERSTTNRLALSRDLDHWFNEASRAIYSEKSALGLPGMGATLLAATVAGGAAYVAHVGDSRAYLYRQGGLLRLTEDHSVAEFRYRRGRISREEYVDSPDRQVLYQALGAGSEVDVDLAEVRLASQDVLVLCSDGLIRSLTEGEVADRIEPKDLERSVRTLVDDAVKRGAPDNIGVVLVAFEGEGDEDDLATDLTDIMARCFLFEDLTEPERLVIAPYLEEVRASEGEAIVEEGEPGDSFYVVVAGKVAVTRGMVPLTEIRAGGHFGELSLARPVARSATVTAVDEVRMLELTRERFQDLISHKPELGARLALSLLDTVGDRLRDLSQRLLDVERAARGELQVKKKGGTSSRRRRRRRRR